MDLLDTWFESIRNGNLKETISLYKNNPEFINKFITINDGRNHYQTNAIIEASYQGNRDLVKWLIDNNADVNSIIDGGWRPIHFAAQRGHVTTVNLLVLGGAEVNVETEAKETPILFALQSYMRDTVKKLLHHGASLVGIDRNYLQMCIQKDILDPAFLDEQNKTYLADTNNYRKIDMNGYDMEPMNDPDIEEIKPIKLQKHKITTEYDNELKRRRQDLLKKIRRTNEPVSFLSQFVRKVAQSENDEDRISLVKEALAFINNQEGIVPQTKFSDQMINILELCLCDSTCSEEFITLTSHLMMNILHNNIRRGDVAVVEFWCRIFDKMTNLQIEQYSLQILKMLLNMIESAPEGVINHLKSSKDTFIQNWEYFFEHLCFPKCLSLSLVILKNVYDHCPEAVIDRFHNVIDIMIGWCIHADTDRSTMESLCQRSVELHFCWLSDPSNLKKTLTNLQKDILTHCQMLSRIHRIDKDRSQVDDLKLKIKLFCFALSCVTSGISKIADITEYDMCRDNCVDISHVLPNSFIINIIEKLAEGMIICSKQIDFDNLLLQSNTVILHLLSILSKKELVGTIFQTIMRYVFGTCIQLQSHIMAEGTSHTNFHSRELIMSFLDIIGTCLRKIHLEPSIVVQVLSPVNWIHSCIFYGSAIDHKLVDKFLRIVDIICESQCVTTFYQILLSDLELALNTLMKLSGCSNLLRLVQSNAFKMKTYEPSQAELVIKYNINLILFIHNRLAANCAVLVPSVPILFTKYLLFTESSITEKYPSTAIFIMHSLAKLNLEPELQPEFIRFLLLLLNTISIGPQSKKEGFLLLKSLLTKSKSIFENNKDMVKPVLDSLTNLILLESDQESIVTNCLAIIIDILKCHESLANETVANNLLQMAIRFSNHASYGIRCQCFKLYFSLMSKPDNFQMVAQETFDNEFKTIRSITRAGRCFKFPIDFSRAIFSWIMGAEDKLSFHNRDFVRLNDLMSFSKGKTNKVFNNRMVMIYDVIVNACWDCVKQKLKFDQNADSRVTLIIIENMMKSILTNGNSLRVGVTDKRFRKLMTAFTTKSAHDQAVSVNLMILLLDMLEKMFYNAYEGCCIGFPSVNKSSETFFVTNKNVCIEWFIKIRLLILALAQYSGQWSTVVWHGSQLLKFHLDKSNGHSSSAARILVPEVEDCIVLTAMAYSKLGNWESLVGLGRLAVDTYGSKFDWIDALGDKTIGRLKSALTKFEKYIRNHHDPEWMKQSSEMRLLTRKANSQGSFILCMEEIADCYKLLTNIDGLDLWKNQLQLWKSDPQMVEAQKSTINWDRLMCLTKLSKWDESIEDTCASLRQNEVSWKYRSVIDHCEDSLFLSIVDKNPDNNLRIEEVIGNLSSLQSISDFPSSFSNPDIILINERLKLAKAAESGNTATINAKALSIYSPTLPISVIGFANAIQKVYKTPDSFANQKYLIQWHRKHLNFDRCHSLASDCFSKFLHREINQQVSLCNSPSPIVQMQLERELVKLLWEEDKKQEALHLLTSGLKDGLLFETSDSVLHNSKCTINTKSLLTLFMWLCNERSAFSKMCNDSRTSSNLQFLIELAEVPWINGLPLVSPHQRQMEKTCQSSVTDVCSQLLILASKSHNQDKSDKSFMTLAQWCLNRSHSLDDAGFNGEFIDLTARLGQIGFSSETIANVELLLSSNFFPSQMKSESDWFGDCYEDATFTRELRASVLALDPDITHEMSDEVIKIWLEFIGQHFSLHIAAAEAYFSFLKDSTPSKRSDDLCNKNRTTASLRILSLLGKRSRLLRESIISKIKLSPPGSWTNVIPQLFARLKHTDKSIRMCMTELLQRLAVSNSNCIKLIIYPTLVGAINENDNYGSPYYEIKKVLVDNNRTMVDDLSIFIKELRRITVLWDELWVSSLGQCYDELNKKAHQLQSEIDKIDAQENLKNKDIILKLKYNSIIQTAVFILERTQAATNMVPETPRECWFYNLFAEEIASTLEEFKCPADIREFNDAWKKIKNLQEIILTECNNKIKPTSKRGRHQFLSLKLDDVSPSLAKINTSLIPLPGMNDKELVSIDEHISILPTKTKPKKFRFLSTDGTRYSYLYKGLEDLRLDERVMQILDIANTMFSKLNEKESNKYHITTYPVTPLGTRAGLIQMVEEATSLFSLYKRHQMRNKNTFELMKSRVRHSNNTETNEATIVSEEGLPIRPTDIYWQKLRPKLEAAKIDISFDNRDKWPLSILIETLTELSRDTPPDLLSKELWCCSINSSNWFKSSISFTRSCAVMSIMGHILGLGDRHLDNLLVNFSTGQMVHIDYNVCFDKGESLKVPEKVPFRLTDIITYVFGPMSVEGLFKISCEKVYEIIQHFQDSILTLMDTFVFDPIVDWSSGIESGHYGSFDGGKFSVNSTKSIIEKRSVEFIINLNSFQSVIITIEDDLKVCQDKLTSEFVTLHDHLYQSWVIGKNIEQIHESYMKKQEMIKYLRSYEQNKECKLIEKFNYIRSLEERALNVELEIKNRLQQLKLVSVEHGIFFNKILFNPDFISLKLDIKNIKPFFVEHVTNIAKSTNTFFDLYNGSDEDKTRYIDVVKDLESIGNSIDEVQNCLVVVDKYRSVIQEMPQSYYTSDRCSYMLHVTEQLAKDPSLANIKEHLNNYSHRLDMEGQSTIEAFKNERKNWNALLKVQKDLFAETQTRVTSQTHDEEILELESIWQLTMFENVAGINIFKAILLEQYMEMANITSQLDANVIAKIPETISLGVDYNVTLRKYLQLLNAHENYFKILSNSMNMFGIYLNTNEANMVCNMMLALQKTCVNILTFENKFIEIIMPESVKIMKQLSSDDTELLDQLKSIMKEGENIMLHFNIAFTSTSYDIKNYDSIHLKTVVPIQDRMAKLTDINSVPIHDGTKQLRILVTSFYTTINQAYQLACDFIDCCMNSSTPSSWNYIDLVAASSINISPIWNKSILLLKDALYMSGMACMVNTLEQCKSITDSLPLDRDPSYMVTAFNNMLRNMEIYFNFINKHILVGVGSQCFGKMFCLLLEHAGWNIDTLIAENMMGNCALNSEMICGSVISFRKTEFPNAVNFYTQLQYRFNNYKTLTGFATDPNLSMRFLNRNISFHKSLASLAKNQLISHCWTGRHLLDSMATDLIENDSDIVPLKDVIDIINGIPDRLAMLKLVLANLELVNTKFQTIGEEINSRLKSSTTTPLEGLSDHFTKLNQETAQSISSIKKRVAMVNDVMVNIDRFECLRSRSERGAQFDQEVMQFLLESQDVLEKFSNSGHMIESTEEDIIKLKEQLKIDKPNWWIDLLSTLIAEINNSSSKMLQQEKKMKELAFSYDKACKDLKTNLSNDYYPLIGHLKPSLRMLHSVTKKLKSYLSMDESTNHQSIRSKVDRVLKLTSLFEKFNLTIDGLIKFLNKAGSDMEDVRDIFEYTNRLQDQLTNASLIKDSFIPELFATLLSLSPLTMTSEEKQPISSGSTCEEDGASKYGFSNNNMAETNGGETMNRLSPSLSGEDPFPDIASNQRSTLQNINIAEVDSNTPALSLDKAGPYQYRDSVIPMDRVDLNSVEKFVNSNSAGVQKAIEVWKLLESRLNLANPKSSAGSTGAAVGNDMNETHGNSTKGGIAINQYVDKLIQSARSSENLARMYEGWTAWV